MSTAIQRPSFFFGQYLGPDDLQLLQDHSRGQLARHQRYLHTWGITSGLELFETGKQNVGGQEYLLISLRAGSAIDGYGREIIIDEDQPLDTTHFEQLAVFVQDAWHPVVVRALETPALPSMFSAGDCADDQPKRIEEGFEVTFLRPGDERADLPDPVEAAQGADLPLSAAPWNILVGFVQWDNNLKQFTAFSTANEGVRPQYAGALADEVVARSGRMVIRSKPASENNKPAIQLNAYDPDNGYIVLGNETDGVVKPLVTIDSKGNLTAQGTISDLKNGVWVESGTISDGMPVPLPAGVTEQQVTDGEVHLHVHLTPRLDGDLDSIRPLDTIPGPFECRLLGRTVSCRRAFWPTDGSAPSYLPGLCDYTIVVTPT